MSKTAHKSIKYLSYSIALIVGVVLAFFGIQSRDAGDTIVGGVLGDTAHADHNYSQASYYSQGYYQSAYGDDGDGGGG